MCSASVSTANAQVAATCVQNNCVLDITILTYCTSATRNVKCDCMDAASAWHTLTILADVLRATGFSDAAMLPDVLDFIGSVSQAATNSTVSVVRPGVHCLSILSQLAHDNGYQAQANKVLQIVLLKEYAGAVPGELPVTTTAGGIKVKVAVVSFGDGCL